jgi:hypothetical protein
MKFPSFSPLPIEAGPRMSMGYVVTTENLSACGTNTLGQLKIDNQDYVAKQLVDIGEGRSGVTVWDAASLLMADLIRLKRMEHFATLFKTVAMRRSVQITSM